MSLSYVELAELEVEIMSRLRLEITSILTKANRIGTLNELINILGMDDLLSREDVFTAYEHGKILVIGGSQISKDKLQGIIKSHNLDKNDFEFCLEYDEAGRYNFSNLHYNPNYRAVLIGPLPHSTNGKGNSSSILSEMETKPGYPEVIRMNANSELKITSTSFKKALENLKKGTVCFC